MQETTAITTVDDDYLCSIIQSVKKRLVFMTPNISIKLLKWFAKMG